MERESNDVITGQDGVPLEVASEDLRLSTARLREHVAEGDQLVRQLHTGSPATDAVLRELLAEISERTAEIADVTGAAARARLTGREGRTEAAIESTTHESWGSEPASPNVCERTGERAERGRGKPGAP